MAVFFSLYLVCFVLKKDEGTDQMKEIARAVREGAGAFLRQQYQAVLVVFLIVFVILLVLSFQGYLVPFIPYAFLSGGFLVV